MPTVKEQFGFLPTSVWHLTKGDYWGQFFRDSGDPTGTNEKTSTLYEGHTEFNPVLAERVYKYWSDRGDKMLDPFAGRTTRGLVARVLGRDYEGYEIGPETFRQTKQNLAGIEQVWQPSFFEQELGPYTLFNADGTRLGHTPDNSKDLIFTCPPYWRLEKYEQCLDQLSQIDDYRTFLYRIRQCATNCYRTLKPKGYCIWVVADFRIDGAFISFHNDVIEQFKYTGFALHDTVINILNSPAVIRVANAALHRQTIKTHEYIIIWKKLHG